MTRVGLGVMTGHGTVVTSKQEDLSVGSIPSLVYIASSALCSLLEKQKGVMFLLEAGAMGNQLPGCSRVCRVCVCVHACVHRDVNSCA